MYELQKSISKNAQKISELNQQGEWSKIMELCLTIRAQALKAWDTEHEEEAEAILELLKEETNVG